MTDDLLITRMALLLAYEAGRWRGQVDLEEHYDREQYSIALAESVVARTTCMPAFPASTGRTVTVNLRSDEWREGVEKSAKERFEMAWDILKTIIEKPKQQHFNFTGETT
jgi:hypothetical protein